MPRVLALPLGGGDAAGWEPIPVRPAGSCCGSGTGETALVRPAASGSVLGLAATTAKGPVNSTMDSSRRTRPAPAGLTESGPPTGCVTASLGRATTRGISSLLVIQSFCITPIQAALND